MATINEVTLQELSDHLEELAQNDDLDADSLSMLRLSASILQDMEDGAIHIANKNRYRVDDYVCVVDANVDLVELSDKKSVKDDDDDDY